MRHLKKKPIQIYIEPKQADLLEMFSNKMGISKAAIIRESLEKYLKELPLESDPAMAIIGIGASGKSDLSENHDKYLAKYIAKKSK